MQENGWTGAGGALALLLSLGLSACGTTYSVPQADNDQMDRASRLFSEERYAGTALAGGQLSSQQAVSQFDSVARRVEPVAEEVCRREALKHAASVSCDFRIVVDREMAMRNAYQTYAGKDPVVAFSVPMILDARNEDEIAFVMGHEVGHHIAAHVQKQAQQQVAGALLAGALMAYATSGDPYMTEQRQERSIRDATEAGAALGGVAFSQTYELEADVVGTHIAIAAGYDPVRGARFFARPESARQPDGRLSFWGTHPPDEKRVATVIATADRIGRSGSTDLVERD